VRNLSVELRARARRQAARLWTRAPGEIAGDELAAHIEAVAADPSVHVILEIGSASGDGSTRAFVAAALRREDRPHLFCLEARSERCAELPRRYAEHSFVHPVNASSVPAESYTSADEVREFMAAVDSPLDEFTLERVLSWRSDELDYLVAGGVPVDGIERIRAARGVDAFDAVLVDGSEFTGRAELELVYGARWLLLDDTRTLKNHANCLRLIADPAYELVAANPLLRNGFAVFRAR
jgi:hypothetical protein